MNYKKSCYKCSTKVLQFIVTVYNAKQKQPGYKEFEANHINSYIQIVTESTKTGLICTSNYTHF